VSSRQQRQSLAALVLGGRNTEQGVHVELDKVAGQEVVRATWQPNRFWAC
jgi:hypothetical protein